EGRACRETDRASWEPRSSNGLATAGWRAVPFPPHSRLWLAPGQVKVWSAVGSAAPHCGG
ncbi:MAG: hypothetical protein NTW21_32760, partial [Verrucomicrobia bacterium]|nr:hypothetical protein [Verrucomicrobiota bacterium]